MRAYLVLPPNQSEQIGKVLFRLVGLDGKTLGDFPGKIETFEAEGNFQRAWAEWPADLSPPGAYQLLGLVYDPSGRELTRVAPRMVSVNLVDEAGLAASL